MIGEIIAIGDEMTSGQRLDTNTQWLATQLGELGVRVVFHTTVADDLTANIAVFRAAVERADIVVASGGLGPTADDLTREALAKTAGVELALDEASLAHIRALFARHNREMPERNRLQAMFPVGSQPIPNSRGTAPGVDLVIPRTSRAGSARVFALPGVPAEMFEMFASWIAPAIGSSAGERKVIRHHRIKCFGAGESQVEQMLPDLIRRGRQPSVGITVSAATITLRITAEGPTAEACYASMQSTIDAIHQSLGSLVFGEEDDELEDVVIRLLAGRDATLATVEAGSEGLLAEALARATAEQESGANVRGFQGGVILTTPRAAAEILDVPMPETDAASLSESFTRDLAVACQKKFGVDFALAIGFFPAESSAGATASGDGASPTSLATPYYFALATPDKVLCRSATLVSHASVWKPRAAKQVMNLLRLTLLHGE
jgi:nicotinamide-nucleotide amidase